MLVLSVQDLLGALKDTIESIPAFADVWVAGEISSLTHATSGHIYFTLKDEAAALRCAFFRQYNRGATLQSGDAVLAHGRINIYEPRGELNFIVDFVASQGAGILAAQFERLRQKLEAEGLFDPARKRPLPLFPRRIGVVTSATGAVWHDIQTVIGRRWPLAELVLAHASVQGENAPAEIVAALEALNERGNVDVIIVARGGGAREELTAFDDERVPRAIYASRVPVISAVGHETDVTLADYAADMRAPTPSAAAEMVVPDRAEIALRVGSLAATMAASMRAELDRCRRDVALSSDALRRAAPDIPALRAAVAALLERARTTVLRAIAERRALVEGRGLQLASLDPEAVLRRGYALVQRATGEPVTSVAAALPGERLAISVHDGTFAAVVSDERATR